jgi:hypothetical protein
MRDLVTISGGRAGRIGRIGPVSDQRRGEADTCTTRSVSRCCGMRGLDRPRTSAGDGRRCGVRRRIKASRAAREIVRS